MKMTAKSGRESEYFQGYSGILCDDLRFKMLGDGLVIHLEQQPNNIRYKHSYSEHQFFKRAQQSNQALLKACNNKQRSIKTVLDLTGGWGIDSFILACHGQIVTCIEQNTLVHNISAYSLHCAQTIKHSAMAGRSSAPSQRAARRRAKQSRSTPPPAGPGREDPHRSPGPSPMPWVFTWTGRRSAVSSAPGHRFSAPLRAWSDRRSRISPSTREAVPSLRCSRPRRSASRRCPLRDRRAGWDPSTPAP